MAILITVASTQRSLLVLLEYDPEPLFIFLAFMEFSNHDIVQFSIWIS